MADRASACSILADTYAKSPFVRVLPQGQPNIHAARTNLCLIGVVTKAANTVIVSVLDNLVKGAAGQAVQNLNLMFHHEQRAGLA